MMSKCTVSKALLKLAKTMIVTSQCIALTISSLMLINAVVVERPLQKPDTCEGNKCSESMNCTICLKTSFS